MSIEPTAYVKLGQLGAVPHPFPYQGSKRALAHAIIPLIPSGAARIIEPFCGSAAISIAAMFSGRVSSAILGDINATLIDLWRNILYCPQCLANEYECMWRDQLDDPRAYFWSVRDEFNKTPKPVQLLYLLNRIVKGSVRYGHDGTFNQSPDHRRLGAKPHVVRDRVMNVHQVMAGSQAYATDFEQLTQQATPEDVIYMDPPYQGTTNVRDHRYMRGLPKNEFEPALNRMNDKGLSFIVSYDVIRDDGKYGAPLSESLGLTHLHVVAGRSSQSTLLGGNDLTVESLYLSPALVKRLGDDVAVILAGGHVSSDHELAQADLF
jgi:DNA adenine methylase